MVTNSSFILNTTESKLHNNWLNLVLCNTFIIVASSVLLMLNFVILFVLHFRKDRFNSSVYKQLFHLGLTDCIQLSLQFMAAICSLAQYDIPHFLNKVAGGIINSAWFGWSLFALFLSFNRFMMICYSKRYSTFFSKNRFKMQIRMSWIVLLMFFSIYLTPYFTFYYDQLKLTWHYLNGKGNNVMVIIEICYVCTLAMLSGVFYACIFMRIKFLKRGTTTFGGNHEVRLSIQASVLCLFTTLKEIHWHFYKYYMPDSTYSAFSINMLWTLNCGISPVLCVVLNKSIQVAVLQLLRVYVRSSNLAMVGT